MIEFEPQSLLTQALQSAHQADWQTVTHTLQRLVYGQGHQAATPLSQLPSPARQQWLDLAMQVLEYGDFQLRWDVGKLLPSFGDDALAGLLDLLADEALDAEMHWFVVRALGDFAPAVVAPALVQLIQTSPEPELRQAATNVLAQMGRSTMTMISGLLEQATTRPLAVQILAQMRHTDAIPMLLELSKDADVPTRSMAIDALSSFHSPQIAQVLQQALSDYASEVRLTAVQSVAFCWQDLPDVEWLDYLQPLLRDIDLNVSRQAVLTIGRIGSRDAIKVLAETLRAPLTPELLAIDVIRSLCWMEQREALLELGQIWATTTLSDTLRQVICQNLGRLEAPMLQVQAMEQLLRWLADDDCVQRSLDLRQAVVSALGLLGQPQAIAPLLAELATAPPRLRLHLVAALKQINGPEAQAQLHPVAQTGVQTGVAIGELPDHDLSQVAAQVLADWD